MGAFRRILVANRGEIAVRVIRAAHELGIEAVAVFSDADKGALHVKMADASVAVGPGAPAESYLHIQRILEAARGSGCDAIHPGYGFLSENATFIRRCADAGIAFIGPGISSIDALADKVSARVALTAAGLPPIPGSGEVPTVEVALAEGERIGYPLMVKAVGGGGGIGMSRVNDADALKAGFDLARTRAEKAFGDGRIYLEKAIASPHHVEVQVLGDGTEVIHFFDRECSIQRRFQKVLEEARAPFAGAQRDTMAAAAAKAAQHIGYKSAGTIECLVEGAGHGPAAWYFLEMNRRIQVEHPITEMITGHDLVQAQIRIAMDGKLPMAQSAVTADGHAIEFRVSAEDPFRFFPSPGTVAKWRVPEMEHVRIDTGVEEGSSVPMFYDSLLAKVCVWGKTRDEAISRGKTALSTMVVEGVKTNIPLHLLILEDAAFRRGDTPTSYLEDLMKRRAGATTKPLEKSAPA